MIKTLDMFKHLNIMYNVHLENIEGLHYWDRIIWNNSEQFE